VHTCGELLCAAAEAHCLFSAARADSLLCVALGWSEVRLSPAPPLPPLPSLPSLLSLPSLHALQALTPLPSLLSLPPLPTGLPASPPLPAHAWHTALRLLLPRPCSPAHRFQADFCRRRRVTRDSRTGESTKGER
jgi:hypothetical protein